MSVKILAICPSIHLLFFSFFCLSIHTCVQLSVHSSCVYYHENVRSSLNLSFCITSHSGKSLTNWAVTRRYNSLFHGYSKQVPSNIPWLRGLGIPPSQFLLSKISQLEGSHAGQTLSALHRGGVIATLETTRRYIKYFFLWEKTCLRQTWKTEYITSSNPEVESKDYILNSSKSFN